jgi:hypothetical protein
VGTGVTADIYRNTPTGSLAYRLLKLAFATVDALRTAK